MHLVNQYQPAGRYNVLWDGNNAKGISAVSGVYFFRISSNGFFQTRKMVLSR
jgi:flagellar hook assembly protein FlgD